MKPFLKRPLVALTLTALISIGSATILMSPMAVAAQAPADEPAFTAAFEQFMRAGQGDSAAAESAARQFAALAAAHPDDPVLLAYAGAATAQQATTTMLPWRKMRFAEDGLAQIDKALALLGPENDAPAQLGTPGVLITRFTAASTFLALPSMFHRRERGQQLMAQVVDSPLLARAPLPFRGTVWLRAGRAAQDEGSPEQARRLWQLAVDQGTPQAPQARLKLQELAR